MIGRGIQVRPAGLQDRQVISSLIFYENHAHRHLDWRPPLDWLGTPFFWLMVENGRALAALACPPDPPGVAWVRLFALSRQLSAEEAWSVLWGMARDEITKNGGAQVGVIAIQGWLRNLLVQSGFEQRQNIVMLEWRSRPLSPLALSTGVHLRPMTADDLPAVVQVDADAFDAFWHNSLDALSRAFSQAVSATVIEKNGYLAGYQISTGNSTGAHLARLAVRKDAQGCGLGAALVKDLIIQMRQRGALRVTVNTQNDNRASLALYQKLGFVRTGEEYPVFRYVVNGTGG